MVKFLGLCAWLSLLGGIVGVLLLWPERMVDRLGRPIAAGFVQYGIAFGALLSGVIWFALLAGVAEALDHVRALRAKLAPLSDAYRPPPPSGPPRPTAREVDIERARSGL